MPDLSIFKIDSQTINIKDTTARQTADSAKTLATTASGNATTALNMINKLESEKADKTLATASANGLMSKTDKTKLDGIDPSAITTNVANIKKNADAISAETTRAKAAEKANADAISAEVTRAKAAEKGVKDSKTNYVNCGAITAADMDAFVLKCAPLIEAAFPFNSCGRTSGMFQAIHVGDDYFYGLWYIVGATEVDLVFFKQRADTIIKCKVTGDSIAAKYVYQNMSTLSARVNALASDVAVGTSKINKLEKLSRVSISYDSTKENMTITIGTHSVA